MDMELEALLFNAIITNNLPAVCVVDSEALISMWENFLSTNEQEEPRSRKRKILEIVKICELKEMPIIWMPKNAMP